jgi:hypothetical protein
VVSFMPRPLYPRGKSPRYPLDRRLGGPQNRSGRRGEEKIFDPTGTRMPTTPSSSTYQYFKKNLVGRGTIINAINTTALYTKRIKLTHNAKVKSTCLSAGPHISSSN